MITANADPATSSGLIILVTLTWSLLLRVKGLTNLPGN